MFKLTYIELQKSGAVSPLILDYLNQKPALKPFYSYFPDEKGCDAALKETDYSFLDREALSNLLHEQSQSVKNTSKPSFENIERLKQKNTFTITTGHQLCLFTGPLYFIYKLISCINLAQELKQKFPSFDFVPVYWMAGEDHDFAEVNHFRLFGKTITWNSSQSGSVGDFNTADLEPVYTQLREVLGSGELAETLSKMFKEAYLEQKTLINATRFLVNELFGAYGLVCVDGNHKTFKEQFKDILKEDIFNNSSSALVEKSIADLSDLGYANQVNPRKINCFFTQTGLRARLEQDGTEYKVLGTELTFSKQSLNQKLDEEPERFSPNVVLRPLFQQRILPNLAYVGGPGELAYWLQYKTMFEHYKVFFPLLFPRNFVSLIEKPVLDKIHKLEFKVEEVFLPEQHLVQTIIDRSGIKPDLNVENTSLTAVYQKVLEKAIVIDKTLESSVKAELQKTLVAIQNLEAKMNRAIKQKSETEINQIKTIRQKLFPDEQPQERVDNFSQFYLKYGEEFITVLKKELNAFDFRQYVLLENI
jgi:bacillithiol biosynthesis cysteine-adding enzyme BshC